MAGFIRVYGLEHNSFHFIQKFDAGAEVSVLATVGQTGLVGGVRSSLHYWRFEDDQITQV